MNIGRKIYYDNRNGQILVDTGERSGYVVETTEAQDFEAYQALQERVPSTVSIMKLEFGQHGQDFRACAGYQVNLDTNKIEFNYPDPDAIQPIYQEPLTEQIQSMKAELQTLKNALTNAGVFPKV